MAIHIVHNPKETNARLPLVHGSAKMQICDDCGAYRYDLHGWSDWRPKEQLAFDLIEREE